MKLWNGLAILAGAILLVACHPTLAYVIATDGSRVQYDGGWWDADKAAAQRSAAHDLPCDASRVTATHPTETQIVADGCGQRAVYTVNEEASVYRVEADGTRLIERHLILVNRFSLATPAR
jgi:hypothetical protein